MYDNLPFKPKMVRAGPKLQAANGESLKVLGSTNLTFYGKWPYDAPDVLCHGRFESELHSRHGLAQGQRGQDLLRLRNAKDRKDVCETSR